MGRGHGGSRGGGASAKTSDKTMQDYSRGLAKAVAAREAEIGQYDVEHLSVFDSKGNETFRNVGEEHSVSYKGANVKDAVLTHNHPGGRSLSVEDVVGAIGNDMREIRATTRTGRVFSLKRPTSGWRISGYGLGDVQDRYNYLFHVNLQKARSFVQSYKGDTRTATRRAYINLAHNTMKQLASEYGWTYTTYKR